MTVSTYSVTPATITFTSSTPDSTQTNATTKVSFRTSGPTGHDFHVYAKAGAANFTGCNNPPMTSVTVSLRNCHRRHLRRLHARVEQHWQWYEVATGTWKSQYGQFLHNLYVPGRLELQRRFSMHTIRELHLYRTVVILLALLALGTAVPAQAQLGLGMVPMRVEIHMTPGQEYSGSLKLSNQSNAKTRVRAEVLDFNIDDKTTPQFERDLPQEAAYSCKKWLSLNPMEIELENGGFLNARYTLRAPADIRRRQLQLRRRVYDAPRRRTRRPQASACAWRSGSLPRFMSWSVRLRFGAG